MSGDAGVGAGRALAVILDLKRLVLEALASAEGRALLRQLVMEARQANDPAVPLTRLVTVAQAAELAGVSVATIRRRIRDHHLPAVQARHGGAVRVDVRHLLPPTVEDLAEARRKALAVK
jgi:excisionase family DNA binding protein